MHACVRACFCSAAALLSMRKACSLGMMGPKAADAQLYVLRNRRLNVRISDIVYQLTLNSSQVDVVLMHGSMQIDGFFANYEWADSALRFLDQDKRTRYELRLTPRVAAR